MTLATLCYVLWFTITITPGHVGHFPIDETFSSLKTWLTRGDTYWVPILLQQFPNDDGLHLYCKPCRHAQGA